MLIKTLIRKGLEAALRNLGGRRGKTIVREISYARDGIARSLDWNKCSEDQKKTVIDDNIPLKDNYCPICDDDRRLNEVSDKIQSWNDAGYRKILYQCASCNYLFTNEKATDRQNYFRLDSYECNQNNQRGQREVDLVNLATNLIGLPKDAAILIYAVGKNKTPEMLLEAGYTNVWSCDIVEGSKYDERFINIEKTPSFFADNDIKFDVITAVEVWEHYSRDVLNGCFEWIFNQVSEKGVILSTPNVWCPENNDPHFKGAHEWGTGQLEWWLYPYVFDHVAFYSEDNLSMLGRRNGFEFSFGYFKNKYVHSADPWKRVAIAVGQNNLIGRDIIKNKFDRGFHDVFY